MNKFILAASIILCIPPVVFAQDTGYETDKDRSGSWNRSMEHKQGRTDAFTTEVQVDTKTLFAPAMYELEKQREPFKSCALFSQPPLDREFGLTADSGSGIIDVYKAQYLKEAGKAGSSADGILDPKKFAQYMRCVSIYGAVLGQAHENLLSNIGDVTETNKTTSRNQISGLDTAGLFALAELALDKAVTEGVKDPNIRALFNILSTAGTNCRFAENDFLKCGPVYVRPGQDVQVIVSGVPYYGQAFAGRSGSFRTTKSNDKVQSAVAAKQKSWSTKKRADHKVNPTRWIPGLGH